MWLEILADLHVKFFVKWEFCAKVVNKSEEFRKSGLSEILNSNTNDFSWNKYFILS